MRLVQMDERTLLGGVITSLIGGLGLMGMTITVIGLYGLVSFAVHRRTHPAAFVPARRAARIDPTVALRED